MFVFPSELQWKVMHLPSPDEFSTAVFSTIEIQRLNHITE